MSYQQNVPYKSKLFKAIEKLPPIKQGAYFEAIRPHECIKEFFVPKAGLFLLLFLSNESIFI